MNQSNDKQQFDLDLSHGQPRIHPRSTEERKHKSKPVLWFFVGSAGQFGFSIIIPLLLCLFAGIWFDTKWASKPTWTLVGLGVGILFSILSLIHSVRQVLKESKKQSL